MLFAQNPECTIPGTNDGMEMFFRKARRNIRERGGNVATGNTLAQSGEKLALSQNMGNVEYRKIAFGSLDFGAVFAKHRKPFRKEGMTEKRVEELVDRGTEEVLGKSLPKSPHAGKMMNFAYSSRKNTPMPF